MAISPGLHNIVIQRGADWSEPYELTDGNDAVINLNGYVISAQAWDKDRQVKYADFSVSYTNRTSGKFELSLTDTQTAAFPNTLYYDVLLEYTATGKKEYYLEGTITVSQGYTR
tara:strand:+ start:1954 stop:2295 length:342 start_codon:yes stop_codon:yes gene_type:complete